MRAVIGGGDREEERKQGRGYEEKGDWDSEKKGKESMKGQRERLNGE